jgi:hypothetical protein
MNFTKGQKVWTPEQGWAKFDRQLTLTPEFSYVTVGGRMWRVATETIADTPYDGDAVAELVPFVTAIYISCNPNVLDNEVEWLSSNSPLSPTEAVGYIHAEGLASHGAKFDIAAPEAPTELLQRLGGPLDRRVLAGMLFKHGILPVKQA